MGSDLSAVDWPVRTERLLLRPAGSADAEATWRYRRLPEVNRWLTAAPTTLGDFRAYFDQPDRLAKTLMIERDGQVIGDLMVAIDDPHAQAEVGETAAGTQAELGWCVAPAHAGRGY